MIALGFRPKTGWTSVVLLDGPAAEPRVLDSRRIELADPDVPESRQPYHAGFGTFQEDDAEVQRLVAANRRFARRVLAELLREYEAAGRTPVASAIVAGSDVDPARIANLHMRAHALEGRLYRDLVEETMREAALPCALLIERDLFATAAGRFGLPEDRLKRAAAQLGKSGGKALGGPWRAEEKAAAMAAWLVMVEAVGSRA